MLEGALKHRARRPDWRQGLKRRHQAFDHVVAGREAPDACRRELGKAYREVLGDNFPAMALVQVGRLFEPEARLEIEATAVVP